MLTIKQVQSLVKTHQMTKPGVYTIPEPPRGETIRLFNATSAEPFTLLGPAIEWRSISSRLDLHKNYWDKTPTTSEHLFMRDLFMFLVPEHHIKYFNNAVYVHVGISLFNEDMPNKEQVSLARERYQEVIGSLISSFEQEVIESLAGISETSPRPKKTRKKRIKTVAVVNKEPNNE